MQKRTSLKDIADKIGVSIAIVSYVLNGQEKEKRVGAELAKKILETSRELNYQPNQLARSLRMKSSKTIGLIVADIANPFFGHLARIIEDEALKYGYNVIFGSSDENKIKSESLFDTFLSRQVDGFIVVPVEGSENQIRNLVRKKVPLVLVDRFFPDIDTCHVVIDNYHASFNAVQELISKGFKKIFMVAYKSTMIHMKERIRGYSEALKVNQLVDFQQCYEVSFEHASEDIELIFNNIDFSSEQKNAVFFATSALSVAGLYCLRKKDVKIPEELGFIGFDGGESFDLYNPPLSYVEQPLEKIGKESVRILIDNIKDAEKISQIMLETKLILRNSSIML